MNTIEQVILLLGGWSVILTGTMVFVGKNVLNKLSLKWQYQYQQEIEKLKGEIARSQTLITSLLATYSAASNAAQQKRIESIAEFWNCVLRIKQHGSTTNFVYAILVDHEIERIYSEQSKGVRNMREHLDPLGPDSFLKDAAQILDSVECLRPFIGDELWLLFGLYQVFNSRTTYLLVKDREVGKITLWKNDPPLLNTLSKVLTKDEIEAMASMKLNSFGSMRALLEQKMVSGCVGILSGEVAIDGGLSQIDKVNALMELKVTGSS